jgi:hypothetical protein
MAYVVAGLMAALSFLVNRAALKYAGVQTVITVGPVLEETTKTLPAFWLGADVLLTHAVFGAIEAGYDWWTSPRHGAVAAFLSVGGHSLFGIMTVAVLHFAGSVILAVGAGILVHIVWNVLLIRLTA